MDHKLILTMLGHNAEARQHLWEQKEMLLSQIQGADDLTIRIIAEHGGKVDAIKRYRTRFAIPPSLADCKKYVDDLIGR